MPWHLLRVHRAVRVVASIPLWYSEPSSFKPDPTFAVGVCPNQKGDALAQEQEIKNLRLISHHDLNGYGNIGEGIGIQQLPGGRRVMYLAHESQPKDITTVDVSDPANPRVINQTDLPHPDMRSNSLAVVDNLLLVAYQTARPGMTPAGMGIYDISVPEEPNQIGFFDTSGPGSRGVHCLWCVDGQYAHLSTGAADSKPTNPKDDQFYMIVDISNPAKPTETGRWWLPGTQESDTEDPPTRHPQFDAGFRLHNANVYPQRPDRAYLGYIDGGFIILDISNMSQPQVVSHVDYHPPMTGFTHTVVPLFDRQLLVVSEEAIGSGDCADWPKLVWIVDASVESNPVMLSTLPMDKEKYCGRPGRYGAHNVHENQPLPTSYVSETLVYCTFFNAGLRVHDISDPFRPEEIAYFVPPVPDGAPANGVNDVYVDENQLIYTVDRIKGGLYILEPQF